MPRAKKPATAKTGYTEKNNPYTIVTKLKTQHPDTGVMQLCQKAGVTSSAYQYWRRRLNPEDKVPQFKVAKKAATPPALKHSTHVVSSGPATAGQLIVIMGNPDQIREVLR